jgi:hypothetical protein
MKHISQLFCFSLLLLAFNACKKDENKIFYEDGTAPALTASRTGTIPLSFATKDEEAIKLAWTNPDYKFTTGVSSQDVNYLVEIDTTGANFTNPNRQSISISGELERTFTQEQFNDFLLNQLVLVPGTSHNVEIRVKSTLGSNSVPLLSNVLKYTVTPYAIPPKVTPPSSNELYITGNAVASDWTNSPPATQKFTRISNTLYTLDVALIGGKSYTFLPVYGSWDFKYSIAIKNDPNMVNGGDFKSGGEDILAPAASGNYKIEVDFQRGKFKVTKL